MENGKWKMENGKWKMENGKWKINYKKMAKLILKVHILIKVPDLP